MVAFGRYHGCHQRSEQHPQPSCQCKVTPLSARLFGVWNITSAIIRIYAAYNIHDKVAYELCMWSFVIALVHFVSETFVYKTTKLGPGIISPLIVACKCNPLDVLKSAHLYSRRVLNINDSFESRDHVPSVQRLHEPCQKMDLAKQHHMFRSRAHQIPSLDRNHVTSTHFQDFSCISW
ncbi:hypothetical protein PHSY_003745 [Pseudozyma hubeiensis SY62]|uniref:Uncharacterized protein n=1 Tax=Pseudozyma hubeiensis (strain SY62) TaxID=1305764 RepID=R9PDI7_PSEHS|nr:hypothetical protein PHSY_003745 [Pseudozyma hubeiensis SY62]GAC96165.1 hypothetical protein PHSY_003745 [Pseudozyma hubeiensis SY62]